MTITQNLERHYDLFAKATAPWEFFSGLGNYVSFILETPELKGIADGELNKRDELLKKIKELEDASLVEMREVKQKLLEIIKRKGIDSSKFIQPSSMMPMPREANHTVLDDLELFESGKISISDFHSNNLQNYLFDIAANILRLGYEEEIKEFIVSNKDYAEYYRRVNGDTDYQITGNEYGNFIFSKTWPERFQQVAILERERKLEPWGGFEALISFWKGRDAALKGKSLDDLAIEKNELDFDGRLTLDVIYAVRDFRCLANIENQWEQNFFKNSQEMQFLKIDNFRRHAATAHSFLLRYIIEADSSIRSEKRTKQTIDISFPESVQWNKVMLKMKEGLQEVEIFYDSQHIITADYTQLGFFVGTKQRKPDRQWGFLCALSVLSATDITQATAEGMRGMIPAALKEAGKNLSIAGVHQIKRNLVKRLQEIFKTRDNPFNEERSEYYEPRFATLPEANLRREELWSKGGKLNENRAYEDSEYEDGSEEVL